MAEIINLNRARKKKAHQEKLSRSSQNRFEHGQSKQDKIKAKIKLAQEHQELDAKIIQGLLKPSDDMD
jgi:hypothetical protein